MSRHTHQDDSINLQITDAHLHIKSIPLLTLQKFCKDVTKILQTCYFRYLAKPGHAHQD